MSRADSKPVVFVGPTISVMEARSLLDATYLPPVSQGDVVLAVQRCNPSCVVIIDGVFQSVPAVRHREILWALHHGIPVIGGASMGAIRAAELAAFGMIGIGLIYRWYRRHAFAPDDAVAVLHGPIELGSEPLTLAQIDLRRAFKAACMNGLIDLKGRRQFEECSSSVHYRRRTWETVIEAALAKGIADGEGLLRTVRAAFLSQKKRDSIAVLEFVGKAQNIDTAPRRVAFNRTSLFVRDLADARLSID